MHNPPVIMSEIDPKHQSSMFDLDFQVNLGGDYMLSYSSLDCSSHYYYS